MLNAEKNYITPGGYQYLMDERDFLTKDERPKVVKIVSWAASLGDRSENADYQYGKRRLREIDRRVRFLNRRINAAQVVSPVEYQGDDIKFGATVTLNSGDDHRVVCIVGVDEINTDQGLISWKSPLGRSLLGKEEGDELEVKTPAGNIFYEVQEVEYKEINIDKFIPKIMEEVGQS